MTKAVATVLRAFLLDGMPCRRYGYELMQLSGFSSGKLYPILAELEGAGWLTESTENAELVKALGELDPTSANRPTRRLYRLGPIGVQAARHQVPR